MGETFDFDVDILSRIADVAEYLDRRGFALMITKKPRTHTWVKMYNKDVKYMNEQMRFGATKVREFRKAKGMTISALAEELGVDRNIVKRMENDDLTHTYTSMKRFADYFGCSIQELLQ